MAALQEFALLVEIKNVIQNGKTTVIAPKTARYLPRHLKNNLT